MKTKIHALLIIVGVAFLMPLLSGCSDDVPINTTDSFIRGVVVEKTSDSTMSIVHLPDGLVDETLLFNVTLRQDAEKRRPLSIVSSYLTVGTNVAFEYRTATGTKYFLDNIATMSTNDIVILDRPSEFTRLAEIAVTKKHQKLLEEERELKALRDVYQQLTTPSE